MATASKVLIHTLKLILMSTGVLSIAILLTPQLFNFSAAQLPAIWSSLRSWLRPPYLYFIINGIIITIVASSRIHHHYMHPRSAAFAGAEEFRHIHHHTESFRPSDTYSNTETKPIISMPAPELSPFPITVNEPYPSQAGFSFSFGAVNLQKYHRTEDAFSYSETTPFEAKEIERVEHVTDNNKENKVAVAKDRVLEDLRNYDLDSVDDVSAVPESETRRSLPTKPCPFSQAAPIARQETFEIVSSFFQSQMEKPSPPSRISQIRKPSTLTSMDETAAFGGKEAGRVKPEKVGNYKTAPRKVPSPPPRTAPLARQETSEIVSSFFQSQIGKPSPPTRLRQNRKLTSVDGTAMAPLPPPPPSPLAPLVRQETSEIVSSFFQSQMEKPPPSAKFGHQRKTSRSTLEGGKVLGVAKPKRGETLESAWKTITEGRHVPLTRRLKKSDTWENQGREPSSTDPSTPSLVRKSGTFTDRTTRSAVAAAKLKKDPSLSQEELNRRVEAFINKVNDDMR